MTLLQTIVLTLLFVGVALFETWHLTQLDSRRDLIAFYVLFAMGYILVILLIWDVKLPYLTTSITNAIKAVLGRQ